MGVKLNRTAVGHVPAIRSGTISRRMAGTGAGHDVREVGHVVREACRDVRESGVT
jgi:hypothetical protein